MQQSSSVRICLAEQRVELSDHSEIDMTSDTDVEGGPSSSFRDSSTQDGSSEKEVSLRKNQFQLGIKSESTQKVNRPPPRQSVFMAWQQSIGYTRTRVSACVQR